MRLKKRWIVGVVAFVAALATSFLVFMPTEETGVPRKMRATMKEMARTPHATDLLSFMGAGVYVPPSALGAPQSREWAAIFAFGELEAALRSAPDASKTREQASVDRLAVMETECAVIEAWRTTEFIELVSFIKLTGGAHPVTDNDVETRFKDLAKLPPFERVSAGNTLRVCAAIHWEPGDEKLRAYKRAIGED